MSIDLSRIDPAVLATIPVGRPPNGTTSNFVNPPSLDGTVQVIIYTALPITIALLLLRLYTRAWLMRSWSADDYLITVAMICVTAFAILLLKIVDGPVGEHNWDVPITRFTLEDAKITLSQNCVYALAALFVKVALLVFYLNIFAPLPYTRYMIWAGIIFTFLLYISTTAAFIAIFIPHMGKTLGHIAMRPASETEALFSISVAQGIIGVVSDFYILFIPIHLVAGLKLPLGRKIGVIALFLTGFLACICAIVGVVYRTKAGPWHDPLWMSVPALFLAVIELCVGIICCSLPVLLVLVKRVSKNESYITMMRYFRSRRSSQNSDEASFEKPEKNPVKDRIGLKIPKPMMTGLMSFVRGKGKSNMDSEPASMGSFAELESVQDSYHEQLKMRS